MPRTSVRVVFPDVEFAGSDVKAAKVVEEFNPLSITIPITTLDLTLYSADTAFSIINPSGKYEQLINRQPMAVYEEVDGVETFIGQFFVEDWDCKTENLKTFKCIDVVGLLDKMEYKGGMWMSPTTVQTFLDDILGGANVPYTIDPDLAIVTLRGWIPICTYREALQQVLFAAGAYIIIPRETIPVIGRLSQFETVFYGPRIRYVPGINPTNLYRSGDGDGETGHMTRTRQRWFRKSQDIVFTTGNAVTRGIRCGANDGGKPIVSITTVNNGDNGRSDFGRTWQQRWRVSQWEGIKPVYDIPNEMQSNRKVNLRPQVTGVEVIAHDIGDMDGEMSELFSGDLPVGENEIRFNQPMHMLSLDATYSTITTQNANYCIITTTQADTVVLSGRVYSDNQTKYSRYITTPIGKDNILKVEDATLVNSSNGSAICDGLFNYYQQRYVQNFKYFSSSLEIGASVNLQTLYNNTLYGVIEKASTDLANGNVANLEAVGIITGELFEPPESGEGL